MVLESHSGIAGPGSLSLQILFSIVTVNRSLAPVQGRSVFKISLIRKVSLTGALVSWVATCTQVPVSDNANGKLSTSSFILLYGFLHCLHLFGYAYTSLAISTPVNKMSQHALSDPESKWMALLVLPGLNFLPETG